MKEETKLLLNKIQKKAYKKIYVNICSERDKNKSLTIINIKYLIEESFLSLERDLLLENKIDTVFTMDEYNKFTAEIIKSHNLKKPEEVQVYFKMYIKRILDELEKETLNSFSETIFRIKEKHKKIDEHVIEKMDSLEESNDFISKVAQEVARLLKIDSVESLNNNTEDDLSFDVGMDAEENLDIDLEKDMDIEGDINSDLDMDIEGDINSDLDMDIEGDINSDLDMDIEGDINFEENTDSDMDFESEGELDVESSDDYTDVDARNDEAYSGFQDSNFDFSQLENDFGNDFDPSNFNAEEQPADNRYYNIKSSEEERKVANVRRMLQVFIFLGIFLAFMFVLVVIK